MSEFNADAYLMCPNDGPMVDLWSPNALDPLATRYLSNYPPLFHFANEVGAEKIIETKSLLARNILDFNEEDQEEYKHGIRLIRENLSKQILIVDQWQFRPPNFDYLNKIGVEIPTIFARIDELISNELDRVENGRAPRTSVYVACLSQNPDNLGMAKKYGRYRIEFGPLIPVIAYATTLDAHASMLTRVTYDEHEFNFQVFRMCTTGAPYLEIQERVAEIDVADRSEFVAEALAADLMVAAANVKRPEYNFECEWRLKTYFVKDLRWNHGAASGHPNRGKLWLNPTSEFTDHTPPRLIQRLRIFDKGIINMVKYIEEDGAMTKPAKFEELRRLHTTGQMNRLMAVATIQSKGLT